MLPNTTKPIWTSWTFWLATVKALLGIAVSAGIVDAHAVGGVLGDVLGPLLLVGSAKDIGLRIKTTEGVDFGHAGGNP